LGRCQLKAASASHYWQKLFLEVSKMQRISSLGRNLIFAACLSVSSTATAGSADDARTVGGFALIVVAYQNCPGHAGISRNEFKTADDIVQTARKQTPSVAHEAIGVAVAAMTNIHELCSSIHASDR
jgi:hypothetical protein